MKANLLDIVSVKVVETRSVKVVGVVNVKLRLWVRYIVEVSTIVVGAVRVKLKLFVW